MAAYNTMANRLERIPMTSEAYKKEREEIIRIGCVNGYKRKAITKILNKHQKRARLRQITTLQPEEAEERKWRGVIFEEKYVQGMKKIMKGLNLRAISNSSLYKTRFQLKSPKDEIGLLEKPGIYRIRCQNGCPFSYVGQTKRRIGQRFDEHVGNFRRNEEGKSAMADHWLEEMHLGRKEDIELLKEVRKDSLLPLKNANRGHSCKNCKYRNSQGHTSNGWRSRTYSWRQSIAIGS